MTNVGIIYLGAALTGLWGISHLFPTKSIVANFGNISFDNKQIITMEWIIEGVALIFMGLLVLTVTLIDPISAVSRAIYFLTSTGLIVLAVVSLFTGFKVAFLPYKLCPFIFTLSALLIFIGGLL
jgi:hypothetical protein